MLQWFFLKQENMHFFYNDKVGAKIISPQRLSPPSLTLCPSQPSTPIQNKHGIYLLMCCLHTCLIPAVPFRTWVGGHLLPDVEPGTLPCACAYLSNMSQSFVIAQQDNSTLPWLGFRAFLPCWDLWVIRWLLLLRYMCSWSRRRPQKVDKRMVYL